MIAVFGSMREFRISAYYPKKNFRLIHDVEGLRGIRWDGVIFLCRWSDDRRLCEARDILEVRQPELFVK